MYNPQRFKTEDVSEAFEFMDRYPLATLMSVSENKPFISHVPLTPRWQGNHIELIGHLARANHHWKYLSSSDATAIFHGPHTYITPQWYKENDVPTWNYSVVHTTGAITLIEDYDGVVSCLKELTTHVEKHWPSDWEFFIPDDLTGASLTKSVIGFKIMVNSIDFKKKLSQNRSAADRAGILAGLQSRKDDGSQQVLADMRRLYSNNGERK